MTGGGGRGGGGVEGFLARFMNGRNGGSRPGITDIEKIVFPNHENKHVHTLLITYSYTRKSV